MILCAALLAGCIQTPDVSGNLPTEAPPASWDSTVHEFAFLPGSSYARIDIPVANLQKVGGEFKVNLALTGLRAPDLAFLDLYTIRAGRMYWSATSGGVAKSPLQLADGVSASTQIDGLRVLVAVRSAHSSAARLWLGNKTPPAGVAPLVPTSVGRSEISFAQFSTFPPSFASDLVSIDVEIQNGMPASGPSGPAHEFTMASRHVSANESLQNALASFSSIAAAGTVTSEWTNETSDVMQKALFGQTPAFSELAVAHVLSFSRGPASLKFGITSGPNTVEVAVFWHITYELPPGEPQWDAEVLHRLSGIPMMQAGESTGTIHWNLGG